MDDRVDALARRAEGRQVRGVQRHKALVVPQRQRRSVRDDETVDADAPGLGARAGVLGGVSGGDVDGVHVGQPQLRYGRPRVKLAAVARGVGWGARALLTWYLSPHSVRRMRP